MTGRLLRWSGTGGGLLLLLLGVAGVARGQQASEGPLPEKVRFNRDVRPILSDACFKCHGFDEKERKADLRLDTREGLTRAHDGVTPVVPGDLSKSEVYRRIVTDDADDVMPPASTGKRLTARQKEVVKRWVEQGMDWEPHWSFTPVQRPDVPKVADGAWARNPVDAFVLARLEGAGLKPAPAADKVTLIRRVTLDLTGLPPTPQEVDTFLADTAPDAYGRLVDRLLASPRYGERMAVDWLDAARYADTHGYHIDSGRDMTRWREWVIDAYNTNKPFDVFTVEQLAGDLLPNPTLDQRIATGFNRNHMVNFEGGAIPEEYHTAYVMDRVNTTGTVWLGLTVACAQCHDHKYDPITQKDYYSLYAFFNNVPEQGLDGIKGNAVPYLKTPTKQQQAQLDSLAASIVQVESQLAGPMPEVDAAQTEWEKLAMGHTSVPWTVLEPAELKSAGGATLTKQPDNSVLASGTNPLTDTYTLTTRTDLKGITAIRVEALPDPSLAASGPGRSGNGNAVLTEVRLAAASATNPASPAPVQFKEASATFTQDGFAAAHAIDGNPATAWALYPETGKPHTLVFELQQPLPADASAGTVLTLTLDFQSPYGQHQFGKFRVSATNSADPHGRNLTPANVAAILAVAPEQRNDAQNGEIRNHYRARVSPSTKPLGEQLARLKKERADLDAAVSTTMVMEEMSTPRPTHVLVRGAYDKKGEPVSMTSPGFLPAMDTSLPKNRLGLAQWLLHEKHPLTSRVTVNRFWQAFFGHGLVKTADDFGSQGELPSHPELLDWLAAEFMQNAAGQRWDVKAFVKLLVTSNTYMQSSVVSPQLAAADPENRLLARGPRFRLQAEFIRDQALAVSGLLDPRIGGPSVSPYQPAGLWEELMSREDGDRFSAQKYVQSHGPDLYRRTMYTFWKRTVPPAQLATFDAPDRETCTVKRARTNTPLQALVLMNDPTYVEASRKLAERLMRDAGGPTPEDRIALAFRLPLARKPTPEEVAVLKKVYDEQLAHYRANGDAAAKLLSVGESPRDERFDPAELAAWTTVASVILNLDEAVTKG